MLRVERLCRVAKPWLRLPRAHTKKAPVDHGGGSSLSNGPASPQRPNPPRAGHQLAAFRLNKYAPFSHQCEAKVHRAASWEREAPVLEQQNSQNHSHQQHGRDEVGEKFKPWFGWLELGHSRMGVSKHDMPHNPQSLLVLRAVAPYKHIFAIFILPHRAVTSAEFQPFIAHSRPCSPVRACGVL